MEKKNLLNLNDGELGRQRRNLSRQKAEELRRTQRRIQKLADKQELSKDALVERGKLEL